MIRRLSKIRIFRYLLSGGTAAGVSMLTFFIFTYYFHVWYIYASFIAYSIAFGVSFSLHKLWTFKVVSFEKIKKELLAYLAVFVFGNLFCALMLFLLVEYAHIHYLIAQIMSNGLIAIANFFFYKHIVFFAKVNQYES